LKPTPARCQTRVYENVERLAQSGGAARSPGFLKTVLNCSFSIQVQLTAIEKSRANLSAVLCTPIEPREAPPTGAAGNDSPTDGSGAQRPAKRDGAALSYGDIADEIERSM
jgi:hypothetical protein